MKVQGIIEKILTENIDCLYLQVENESHRHAVPANSETHFKVTVVSEQFNGKMLIARHRLINELLAEQLAGPVHALAMHTYTPLQWQEKGNRSPLSADCMGGGK
ncbi:BolA family transcriptional regulator [Psychromonas sp. psych-6C06]|uniref:BolA family protein n=1 Tax=Psychromonas sp. psych-6C06 TaxID=2058089 RepID=UPI000C33C4D2|nr:BolA family protein [Psychromonas sp. psych-6C06]PKF62752.1 BolA family transcriptional regulator [Psychromonas sp. psych-6C06]